MNGSTWPVQSALSDFLRQYPWDAYFTATFKPQYATDRPRLALDRIIKVIPVGIRRGFVAAEPHYLGNYHVHGLVWGGYQFDGAVDKFLRSLSHYGYYKLEVPSSNDCASLYCSKYITKSLCDWDVIGHMGWNKKAGY